MVDARRAAPRPGCLGARRSNESAPSPRGLRVQGACGSHCEYHPHLRVPALTDEGPDEAVDTPVYLDDDAWALAWALGNSQ